MTATIERGAPAGPTSPPARPRRSPLQRREARLGLLFALPCFLLFLAFRFGPGLAGVALAFFHYEVGDTPRFTGLANLSRLLSDDLFWQALRVTVVYSVIAVPLSLVCSLAMALLVRKKFRTVAFFRSVFFLPVVTSLVLAATVFTWIFSSDGPWTRMTGPALGWLGGYNGSWLASSVWVLPAMALVSVWSRFGYGMLIILARLQDLPAELEEAALTDGANSWQRFRYIVLPQLKPALFFLAVIETTGSFQVFDLVYVMTGGGPAHGSYTLVFQLVDQGFKFFDLGYASAIGLALFVMTIVVAIVQRLTLGRES
ncbi:multiple sugar transport system permease protein [Kribbella aluminosa]|uniref:Multiple sugar transport system permease protein n=1 Tax=Kribbella aluminosa TaxID=416017 RepID=A0ABS4UFU3_9ACTN|nr:sugar ABC transporter permease [Kribbella aluminosa]MBP2350526.1 multiple sugar transport system permease protein [Kribbella aluminosa]